MSRKQQAIELAVFLLLIVPSIVGAPLLVGQTDLGFPGVAVSSILSDLALMSLVLYFLWRNGEPLAQIGWTLRKVPWEVGWGLVLFLPVVSGANLLDMALQNAGLAGPSKLASFLSPSGAPLIMLAFVLVTVVAVVEETIFRGYLILRLKAATGRLWVAVLLSSAIFSLGHGYEGLAGMISVFSLGLVFALVYLWRKSLVAPIIMHFLTDFSSIVLPALLGAKP